MTNFYSPKFHNQSLKSNLLNRSYNLIKNRPHSFVCNFVNVNDDNDDSNFSEFENLTLVYRHYATLYFAMLVDESESNLGILDLIQVFVEALDKCFETVCELDLVFHFDQVSISLLLKC